MFLFIFFMGFIINCTFCALETKGRIIGGTQTNIFNIPYQVSLHYNGHHHCGGSIISSEFVLTAAHCVYLRNIRKISANAGGSYHSVPTQTTPIYRYKVHDLYNDKTFDNDIAILQLVLKLSFGPKVLPVALPSQDEIVLEGSYGVVAGWGQIRESIKLLSGKLRTVRLPIISRDSCQALNAPKLISDNMICASSLNGGKDTCQGDSGSGFVFEGKLFGITSWGIGCGRRGKAGVYTKVSKYRNWITIYTGI